MIDREISSVYGWGPNLPVPSGESLLLQIESRPPLQIDQLPKVWDPNHPFLHYRDVTPIYTPQVPGPPSSQTNLLPLPSCVPDLLYLLLPPGKISLGTLDRGPFPKPILRLTWPFEDLLTFVLVQDYIKNFSWDRWHHFHRMSPFCKSTTTEHSSSIIMVTSQYPSKLSIWLS